MYGCHEQSILIRPQLRCGTIVSWSRLFFFKTDALSLSGGKFHAIDETHRGRSGLELHGRKPVFKSENVVGLKWTSWDVRAIREESGHVSMDEPTFSAPAAATTAATVVLVAVKVIKSEVARCLGIRALH